MWCDVCVCMREREKEGGREGGREKEKGEREGEGEEEDEKKEGALFLQEIFFLIRSLHVLTSGKSL